MLSSKSESFISEAIKSCKRLSGVLLMSTPNCRVPQPRMAQSLDSNRTEEARIRRAYAKREEADSRYSWFNPGYQFMVQQRERRLLALLRRHEFADLKSKAILEVG